MNTKSIIAAGLTAILLLVLIGTPAAAGSRERGRFEGFALGFGAAVLGHALLHHHHASGHYHAPVDRHPPQRKHFDHRPHGLHKPPIDRHSPRHRYDRRRGHWELQRIWVPPVYKKKWKPGHRNPRGRWIPGCWSRVTVSRGYWKKERIWVVGR